MFLYCIMNTKIAVVVYGKTYLFLRIILYSMSFIPFYTPIIITITYIGDRFILYHAEPI